METVTADGRNDVGDDDEDGDSKSVTLITKMGETITKVMKRNGGSRD